MHRHVRREILNINMGPHEEHQDRHRHGEHQMDNQDHRHHHNGMDDNEVQESPRRNNERRHRHQAHDPPPQQERHRHQARAPPPQPRVDNRIVMHHERHEERDPDHEPSDSSDGDEIHRRPPPFGRRPPPIARHPHMPPNHNEPRPHPFHEDNQGYYNNRQREEELFGKLKFTMPTFKGDNDPEEYLTWALKVDKIFRVHNYSEEKMVAMASLEFDGYANQWWEQVQQARYENNEPPIATWEAMKAYMHARFVPQHYKRDLFNKLQQLKQGTKTVEEYFKEMELNLMRANVHESAEQTMARFLNGLSVPIKRIADFQPYSNLVELVHNATKAERQVMEDNKYEKMKAFYANKGSTSTNATNARNSSSNASKAPMKASNAPPRQYNNAKPTAPTSTTQDENSKGIVCFKCGGKGHKSFECINTRVMFTHDNGDVESMSEGEYEALVKATTSFQAIDMEQDTLMCDHDASPSLVVTKVLTTQVQSSEDQRFNIFQTRAGINGKSIKVIIDGGSCHNLASTELCEKLHLPLRKHASPYHVQWLSDNGSIKVQHTVSVTFKIGHYEDTVECDVVPMTVCHMLLGRPWQYDKGAHHDGRSNIYSFTIEDKTFALAPDDS